MKEHPILFSTPMVQAILNGNKTMTRRVIKNKNFLQWVEIGFTDHFISSPENNWASECPYGQPGDRLFVKETWKVDSVDDARCRMLIDFKAIKNGHSGAEIEAQFTKERYAKFRKFYQKNGWQSPYFMPKEATRIWLSNEGVRVERAQDITEEDAVKEGFMVYEPFGQTARADFQETWNILNAKRGYGWEVNPWVWVVEFKVISGRGDSIA